MLESQWEQTAAIRETIANSQRAKGPAFPRDRFNDLAPSTSEPVEKISGEEFARLVTGGRELPRVKAPYHG